MYSQTKTCREFHRLIELCGIFILVAAMLPTAQASYKLGVGIADTTGPVAEIVFLGYANVKQKGAGLHLRTFSRAFIIDDGTERFVFVSVESAMVGHDLRNAVLNRLESQFGDTYNERNVMISATHTHSTPGGHMMYVLFDLTTYGFIKQSFVALVNGITESIRKAHSAIQPGILRVGYGEVLEANINRSPQAYLNNPQSERDQYQHDVDKTMTQLQFLTTDSKPLGVINWFAVHPTSMNNTNQLVSSDNVGYAAVLFEKRMNKNTRIGKGPFIAAFASTNLGDVSPNIRGPKCEFSGEPCSSEYTCPGEKERCFASGPGSDMFESTRIIAERMYAESVRIWQSQSTREVHGPLRVVHRFVHMPAQTPEFYNETTKRVETVLGCDPAMGYSFAAGTTDGPGSSYFEQGTKETNNPMWNIVRDFVGRPTASDISCHGAKPILLATGRMKLPYPWQPKDVSTQVAVIGNFVIAGVPGEFTTMSGRRMRATVKSAMLEANGTDCDVVVAGLCNTYSDYVTTPEEYEVQRYEGASTIYGPHTLTIYLKEYRELVMAAVQQRTVEPGLSPPDMTTKMLISLQTPVIYDTPRWGNNFGNCLRQPPTVVYSNSTVTVRFVAGHPRNNLMTGRSFLLVQRLDSNGGWNEVACDADWETRFHWTRTSSILGTSEVEITWDVPADVVPGEYRIRHDGHYKYVFGGIIPYHGWSQTFQVKT